MSVRAHPALVARRTRLARVRRRRGRDAALALIVATAAAAGAWWLLTGPLLAVTAVEVDGYDRTDLPQLEAALGAAAARGTSVAPAEEDLRTVAARFPWVDDLVIRRDLPRGLRVQVIMARPAAVAVPEQGEPALVTEAGRVLGPAGSERGLARFRTADLTTPAAGTDISGEPLAALRFAAAAEPEVAARLRSLRLERGRLLGRLDAGPRLRLGPPERLPAKARSLAAVLNHLPPEAEAAATYLDLSVPERPALVGGPEAPVTLE